MDLKFEQSKSAMIQPLHLNYRNNTIQDKKAIIFVNTGVYTNLGKDEEKLDDELAKVVSRRSLGKQSSGECKSAFEKIKSEEGSKRKRKILNMCTLNWTDAAKRGMDLKQ